ncbi:MAG: hypothetical protein ACRDPY_16265 [Streptosporangiaceae bacterium]
MTEPGTPPEAASAGASWQRPPFEPGNTAAETHGAYSERRIAPLADEIARSLLEHPDTPPWIKEPAQAAVVAAWARAEAVVSRLWAYLDDQGDIVAALTEQTTSAETEEHGKTKTVRKSISRRVTSVLSELHRAETRAMNLRSRLGLDPLSRAKLMKDMGQARWYAGQTPLDRKLAEIEAERRQAIEAADDA